MKERKKETNELTKKERNERKYYWKEQRMNENILKSGWRNEIWVNELGFLWVSYVNVVFLREWFVIMADKIEDVMVEFWLELFWTKIWHEMYS